MMSDDRPAHSAEIIAFTPFAKALGAPDGNRFTTADRLDMMRWQAADQGGVRLAIHKRRDDDPPEVGEFASIYPANGRWAAWGAVRQGRKICVWRSHDGRDIGRFETMGEVLAAVGQAALTSQARGRARRRLVVPS
jgi:hypothetical protein